MQEINDRAYTLRLEPIPDNGNGKFRKGHTPWNKGMTWREMGMTDEQMQDKIAILRENKKKNTYAHIPDLVAMHEKPVIQMDEDGNRLHWYRSSAQAARKLGLIGRNIRKVCNGERYSCGGFRWKFDERF